jgi:hypothetical protein
MNGKKLFDDMYEQVSEMISNIEDFTEDTVDAEILDKADEMYWTLDNFKTMIEEMKELLGPGDDEDNEEDENEED